MSHTHSRPMSWVSVCGVCDVFLYLFGSRQQEKSLERGRQKGESFPVCLAFFCCQELKKMLQMCNFGQNTAVVTVTFYPAIQSQWWRGETNSTRTNPHILHVQVLNINSNGEDINTAGLCLSMFITDDIPRLPQYQNEKQRLEEHFVCCRSVR